MKAEMWGSDTRIDQWNGTENTQINLYICVPLIFEKHTFNSMGRGWSLQQMVLGQLDIPKQNSDYRSLPHTIHKTELIMHGGSKCKG
jgi:hypothetical protein